MGGRARKRIGSLTALAVTLALLSALVTSCTEPIQFHAAVDPERGHVPYAARIVCTQLAGTYTYRLPGRETAPYHAVFRGLTHENAYVVYPLYTGETTAQGRPYAPALEDGSTYDAARVCDVFGQATFPAQSAAIRAVVQDEWGRLTAAFFEIPIEAATYGGGSGSATDYKKIVFYVAGRTSHIYHRSTRDAVCQIPKLDHVYFRSQGNAEGSGKKPAPDCPDAPPSTQQAKSAQRGLRSAAGSSRSPPRRVLLQASTSSGSDRSPGGIWPAPARSGRLAPGLGQSLRVVCHGTAEAGSTSKEDLCR